jgi:hypothetical protein
MQIEFTAEEMELLRQVLEQEYRELKGQSYKAEDSAFRDQLHHRRDVLEALLAKAGSDIPTVGSQAPS